MSNRNRKIIIHGTTKVLRTAKTGLQSVIRNESKTTDTQTGDGFKKDQTTVNAIVFEVLKLKKHYQRLANGKMPGSLEYHRFSGMADAADEIGKSLREFGTLDVPETAKGVF